MLTKTDRNRITVNLWTARIVPLLLAGIVGYATYVAVALLCVNYLLIKHDNKSAAIPILVIYFLLFILMTVSFLRLVHITVYDPPYVPLGPAALRDRKGYREKSEGKIWSEENGIGTGEYDPRNNSGGTSPDIPGCNNDPDSPGLELFYTKNIFVCEMDGRPIWCSQCSNWKPDRTHHDSSSGRCIRKMDHFCPWVGGPVGENNFKFFIQFNAYTALYCFHLLIVMAVYIHQQNTAKGEDVNQNFCAILALATFFGLFTAGMAGTSLELAANNLTQIEKLGGKTKVHLLAVLKPSSEELRQKTPLFAPEVFYREITYPLGTGFQSNLQISSSVPITAANGTTPIPRAVGNRQNRQAFNEPGDQSSAYPRQHLLPAETTELSTQSLTNPVGGARDAFSPGSQEQDTSTQLNQNSNPREPCAQPSTVPPRDRQDTISPAGVAAQQSDNPIRENERPREILSARDSRATRTFAILKMLNRGDNPWDLGSVRLNLETVMGNGIVDWLLPIRRSPCCNHEDAESQFRVGPKVDFLRASCYFIEPNEVRLPKKIRKESERIERAVNQPASDPSLNGPHAVPMGHLSNNSQSQQG